MYVQMIAKATKLNETAKNTPKNKTHKENESKKKKHHNGTTREEAFSQFM